jgi:hypothetical protein
MHPGTSNPPATIEPRPAPQAEVAPVVLTGDAWMDQAQFRYMFTLAKTFSESEMVPQHFRGKPNDVLIVLQMAARSRLDPFGALQNIYVHKGKPGMHAPYAISLANRCGVFAGRMRFRTTGEGDNLAVTAIAKLSETGEDVSKTATMRMARDEEWTKNSKYRSMPEQMLSYRAAMMLIRLYCPEVTNGMATIEDLDLVDVTPARVTAVSAGDSDDAKELLAKVRKQ